MNGKYQSPVINKGDFFVGPPFFDTSINRFVEIKLDFITDPTRRPLIGDAEDFHMESDGRAPGTGLFGGPLVIPGEADRDGVGNPLAGAGQLFRRHKVGANFLYYDGHVDQLTPKEARVRLYDSKLDPSNVTYTGAINDL